MSKLNSTRNGCKDVFHSFMVQSATYEGKLEIPRIAPEAAIPERLISFSKAISGTDYDAWVHFFEDDASFERLWNQPLKYLPILKRYKGVIAPDFMEASAEQTAPSNKKHPFLLLATSVIAKERPKDIC